MTSESTGRADAAIAVVRRMFDAISSGVTDDAQDYIGEAYVNLEASDDSAERANLRGPEEFVATVKLLRGAFSHLSFEEQEIVSMGDEVALLTVERGVHTGPFFGIPPTGRTITHKQAHFFRVVDGKVTEHKAVRDDLGLMLQLDALQWKGQTSPDRPVQA